MANHRRPRLCCVSLFRDICLSVAGIVAGISAVGPSNSGAQEFQVIRTENGVIQVPAGQPFPPQALPSSTPAESPPEASAEPPSQEPSDGDAAEEDKEDASPAEETIRRPKKPPRVPDPREFDARPDENQRVTFNFYGQTWPDVLQWLATISECSLDWQQLPNDYVNFATERSYSLEETRNVFNRMLFERGFTLVRNGSMLMVMKIESLDPSVLRRVADESELLDLPAHDFVKITFPLPTQLKANQAAEDVKPIASKHAKIQPLMATNRLLVIDIVANLREISRLINAEHAAALGHPLPQEIDIRFARADQVADQVMIILGLDPSSRRTPQELQLEQQRLQLFTQLQKKGKDVTKYLGGDGPKVFLAVNYRKNSIIVNSDAEQLAIIRRTIEMLDVPDGMLAGAAPAELTLQRYPLITASAETVLSALEEMAALDPRTRLKVDGQAKAVLASANPKDHQRISEMIARLDGLGRQFDVIWLRRLPADAVALTIQNLMVGKGEEEDDDWNPFWYSPRRRGGDDKKKDAFRVDADIEMNRLLVWANPAELERVHEFLEKLGETPGKSANPNKVRVLDAYSAEETARNSQTAPAYLEQRG